MEDREWVRGFIESRQWIFAKTMADIPHWYCLKRDLNPSAEECDLINRCDCTSEEGWEKKVLI